MSEFAVEMRGISKHFGGIRALDHVSFSVRRGEVHALLGENGAGKSTLMKILSGAYRRDEGEIRVGGKEVEIGNPHVSRELGIGIIYQELVLAPDLSVAENIFLGELPGLIPWRELQERSRSILQKIGFDLDPKRAWAISPSPTNKSWKSLRRSRKMSRSLSLTSRRRYSHPLR